MSIKNVILGAPLPPPPGSDAAWGASEKRKFHAGVRAGNYNMYLAVQRMIHNWGVGLVDGFEGMEGNGPVSGTPVPHRIALASTDFLAVDRVGVECMGIDVKRKYLLRADVDRMLQWRGPMEDLPPNLGRRRPPVEEDLSQYA